MTTQTTSPLGASFRINAARSDFVEGNEKGLEEGEMEIKEGVEEV